MNSPNTTAKPQHDSDCSIHNAGVPEMLGPCDCSLAPDGGTMKTAAAPEHWTATGEPKPGNPLLTACTDERMCSPCFSGQGECKNPKP